MRKAVSCLKVKLGSQIRRKLRRWPAVGKNIRVRSKFGDGVGGTFLKCPKETAKNRNIYTLLFSKNRKGI